VSSFEYTLTDGGFRLALTEKYTEEGKIRLLQESSAIGDYEDSWDKPGSSFLWVGAAQIHLNREQIAELVEAMKVWLETGRLPPPTPIPPSSEY